MPSYYYFLFYQHWQLLLQWTDSLLYNSKPCLVEMFSMRSYTRVDTFVQIRQKTWPPLWLWKFWLVDFQETSSQEPLKGLNWNLVYMFLWMSNMCCYCLRHLKIQSALKPYGKQHFHLLLENSRTEFNQTWQRCFMWGPKKLSWFVLTRPTHWVLSLLCIGQFVMPIILAWVLFCSKCAELLLDQEKQRVTI